MIVKHTGRSTSPLLRALVVVVSTWALTSSALAQDASGEAAPAPAEEGTATEPAPPTATDEGASTPSGENPEPAEPAAPTGDDGAEPTDDRSGQAAEPPAPESAAGSEPPPAADIAPPTDLPSPEPAESEEPASEPAPTTPAAEAPAPATGTDKPKLLVMALKANGVPAGQVSAINAAVQQQATRSFVGEVVTAEQLRVTLDANSLQQLVGCDSENCMADFGSRVDAKVVLGGNVTAVGDDLIITVLALEPATGKAIGSEQRKVPQVDDLVFYAARQLTSLVLTGRAVDPTVPVRITANAEEAVVFIDGRSVGMAPITVPLDPGQHEVKLEAEDYTPWKLTVSVEEGAPLSVDAILEESGGFPLWPIALVFAGGGAVFGTAWAGFGLHAVERRYGSPPVLGWTSTLGFWGEAGLPVLFDAETGPYEAPNKNTAQLSADSNMITLLAIMSDVFLFMTVVSILAAGALVTTDVVLWALEE